MLDNQYVGIALAALVLVGLFKLLGPKPGIRVRIERSRRTKVAKRKRRRVAVDPLVLKERRLEAELREVRAAIKDHNGTAF